jgi:hypothetical protein
MSITNWGELTKALDDAQTILEAIAEMIAEHDDDPDAHLGENGSLLSHKASEIIDHLAESIVADKYADQSVGVNALNYDKIQIVPSLNSVDGFLKVTEGSGAAVTPFVSCIEIKAGDASENITSFAVDMGNYLECNSEYSPFFECKVNLVDLGSVDYRIAVNGYSIFSNNYENFGFEMLYTDSQLYAFYTHNNTKYRQALGSFSLDGWVRLRAEFITGVDSGHGTINFYVNGELLYSYTNVAIYVSSSVGFGFGIKNTDFVGENPVGAIADIIFAENVSTPF